MGILGDLIVRITGEDKQFKDSITKSENKVKKFTKFILGAAGIAGAIFAFRRLAGVAGDLVKAYGIQEEAETKLKSAIIATGKEATISADSLFEYASELQSVTTFGDEVTISALALLQQLADLSEEGLKEVIPGVQDMALALGVSLETAASLVGKTLGSTTNALSRYGIVLDATAPKEEKLIQLTEELDKKFGGLSRDLALTGTGAIKQFNNVLGDLKEEGGKALLEILAPLIRDMTNFLTKTLQNIRATQLLNKVTEGRAVSVREVDKAVEIQNKRLDEAREKEKLLGVEIEVLRVKAMTGGRLQIEQSGHDLEMKKLQLASTEKAIEKGEETLIILAEERKELVELEKIKTANVEISAASIETTEDETEALENQIEALEYVSAEQILLNDLLAKAKIAAEEYKNAIDEMEESALSLADAIKGPFSEAWETGFSAMGEALVNSEAQVKSFKEIMKDMFVAILKGIGRQLTAQAVLLAIPFTPSFNPVSAALSLAGAAVAFTSAGIVRALEKGGIVTRPTIAMIGEKGPEAVVPLDKGPIHLTVNIGSKVLYDEITKGIKDRQIRIEQ